VPQPAVAGVVLDGALETLRPVGDDVADIDVEPLQ
jgi:hypothetical protein